MRFKVVRGTKRLPRGQARELDVTLNLPGTHNVQNALAAIAVAQELEIRDDALLQALAEFEGVGRRLQRHGEVKLRANCVVSLIDDYGHHPVEILATLSAAKKGWNRRTVVVFQPHRYSRVQALQNEFARAFYDADVLAVTDIYPAGEAPIAGVTSEVVAHAIEEHGHKDVTLVKDIKAVPDWLVERAREGDMVITLGAGSIWKAGEEYLRRIKGGA
jgi:UDP-N-acetylmuramate--alanine ligase